MTVTEMTYTSDQVCEMVGISYRQLDYWLRQGYIVVEAPFAPGSGRRRSFGADELVAICAVAEALREAHGVLEDFASGALWERACYEQSQQKGTLNERRERSRESAQRQRHPSSGRRGRAPSVARRRPALVGGDAVAAV